MLISTYLAPENLSKRTYQLFLLTALLCIPALFAGYMGDDYIHHALLSTAIPIDKPNDLSLFGLFSFINGDPERNRLLMDYSLIPWWTYSELKYAFWRPISEITHWIDHTLWPNHPWLMHLHNILWYLAIVALAARLYRKTLVGSAAVVALALYALDSSHGFTLSWIANRNGLISVTFGLLTLMFYTRWRESDSIGALILSLVSLALGLLSAEMGISVFGYLGAYALFMDKRGWLKGCLAASPHFLVIIIWWLVYKGSGFGAAHADSYYVDPAEHPITFILKLVERFPVLLASQWGIIPAEIYGFSGATIWGYVALCALFLAVCLVPILFVGWKEKSVRFWFFGMLFSILPALTALPHDRLLMFAGIGAAGILGHFLNQVFIANKSAHRKITRVVAYMLVGIHLILSPILLPVMAYSTKVWADLIPSSPSYFSGIDNIANKQLVLFSPPIASALAIGPLRFYRGEAMPERVWTITSQNDPLKFELLDENTLSIVNPEGFMRAQTEKAFRNIEKYPFEEGEVTGLSGLSISIHDINREGVPTKLVLTFKEPVREGKLKFLQWDSKEKAYKELTL